MIKHLALIGFSILVSFYITTKYWESQTKEFPEFKRCSCDSATFCLNDQDVMILHMWKSFNYHKVP